MWDDLIENLWRYVVAVGVVLVAVVVGFSRLVYSTFQGVKKTNFQASPFIKVQLLYMHHDLLELPKAFFAQVPQNFTS